MWFEDDAGNVFTGDEAVDHAVLHFDRAALRHRQAVRRVKAQAHAHRRTGPRPRGSGRPGIRRSAQRSSVASGDSGGDDPPEPPGRRLETADEIAAWVAERRAALAALTQPDQLSLDDLREIA